MKHDLKIYPLGYGDVAGWSKEKFWPCFLVEGEDFSLFLDLSPAYILAEENAVKKTKAILLSHRHADHILGFPLFAVYASLNDLKDLYIIGPDEAIKTAFSLLKLTYSEFYEELSKPFIPVTLRKSQEEFYVGNIFVKALKVPHFTTEAYAYRIETAGKSICYTGDCSFTKELLQFTSGCDVLLAEFANRDGHLKEEDIKKLERNAKRIYYFHNNSFELPNVIEV